MLKFREGKERDASLIYKWRTKKRISDQMTTDIGSLKQHVEWYRSSNKKTHYYHWIITINGIDIGLINLAEYDAANKMSHWGFYIGDDNYVGLGGLIPPFFYNWVFRETPIEKLEAELLETNKRVIALHKMHGYLEAPMFDRQVQKGPRMINLKYLWLDKAVWLSKKEYKNQIADFPTNNWKGRIE